METWAIVALVLGTNAVSALLTFLITKMQVSHSDRRFEEELNKEIVMYHRQRRWIVWSKPLLNLRAELARMAVKEDKLVAVALAQHTTRFSFTEEELKKTLDDSNSYLASGDFANARFTVDDAEIVNKADKILTDYQKSYTSAMRYSELTTKERLEALNLVKTNRSRIIEAQSLINKRLEDL